MKIFYDLIYFEKEECGGTSRMWEEHFKKICNTKLNASFFGNTLAKNTTMVFLRGVNFCNGEIVSKLSSSNRIFSKFLSLYIVNSLLLPKKNIKKADIFHSTGFSNPLIKPKGTKIVTTIHDMVFWDQKNTLKKGVGYWDNVIGIYHSLKISDRIITVSEASKQSIVKHYPWAEDKIDVIYHGLSEEFFNVDIRQKKDKYFLFIGGRNQHKNYDLLLRAFSLLKKSYPEYKLYVFGQNNHTIKSEKSRYAELGIESRIHDYGMVSQKRVVELIQNSTAVVIPSINEGFNFPLLEGMACGAPVLSSNIPVSREIGREYVQYFDNNEKNLLDLMQEVIQNGVGYNELKKSQNYACTFDWERSYKDLLKVYKLCIQK